MSKSIKFFVMTLVLGGFSCAMIISSVSAIDNDGVVDGVFEEPEIETPATTEIIETEETTDAESIQSSEETVLISKPEDIEPEYLIGPESTEEPTLWPMYLSFGAIAVTLLLVVFINVISRARQK